MRKLSVFIALIFLASNILVSCKEKTEKTQETSENQRPERKGPPPHGERKGPPKKHGDRKGPPPGGGPEQRRTLDEIGGYKIGEVATDFNLKNIDGSMVSLSGIEDAKGYIVTFTCNECPFAKLYEDRLIALHNTYAPLGYPVVAINPNSPENEKEGFEAMQKRAKEKGFPFAYLMDEGQKIYPQYGAVRTPHVFLLDKERKVQYIGTIDNNARSADDVTEHYVENAIEALEKGSKPDPNLTKAIGCPIKPNRA